MANSKRWRSCVGVLALGLVLGACVDDPDADAELADDGGSSDDGSEGEDDEARSLCIYLGVPATDDSDTLVGAATQVDSYAASAGGCDLHMFQVAASAPGNRARKIEFQAVSLFEPVAEYQARVWTKSCFHGCGSYVTQGVTLTPSGGGVICIHGACIQQPWVVQGEVDLAANNTVADIRAGMRALTADGDPLAVTIVVSE